MSAERPRSSPAGAEQAEVVQRLSGAAAIRDAGRLPNNV